MWDVEEITVKRLVQWSLLHGPDRLVVNNAYARVNANFDVLHTGKYLLDVMHGVEISVLHVNILEDSSHIVDGARRVGALVKFYQGSLPLVVKYADMPDNVVFRPYNVREEVYTQDRYRYGNDTLVEAYYSGLPASMKCSFLDARVGIVKLQKLNPEQEHDVYWQNNCICPSSPLYTGVCNDTSGYEDVASRMDHTQLQKLLQVLCVIERMDEAFATVARAAVLDFARSMLAENETNTVVTTSSTVSSSTSDVESDEEHMGPQMV